MKTRRSLQPTDEDREALSGAVQDLREITRKKMIDDENVIQNGKDGTEDQEEIIDKVRLTFKSCVACNV